MFRRLVAISRRLVVRVALIASLAVLSAKLTSVLVWQGAAEAIGARALGHLLDIIASSMLAVTTFSLTVMLTVHRGAAAQFTPRVLRTLREDTIAQNVLATFVGAWVYALTAIVMLSTPYFGEREIVALYLTTLVVLVLIVVAVVRWIHHMQTVGSFVETVGRIEGEVREALDELAVRCAGTPEAAAPSLRFAARAPVAGYVRSVDLIGVQEDAAGADAQVAILVAPGDFVAAGDPIATTSVEDEGLLAALGTAIPVGPSRSSRQDPRFGLQRLSEIASKALSPAVNDAGTAIDVVGRLAALCADWRPPPDGPRLDRAWARPVDLGRLLLEAVAPIARDGAPVIEVSEALQDRLGAVARRAVPEVARAARAAARHAEARARAALDDVGDVARLDAATAWLRE